jgi:tetratricopeptide (TPR) repeat protein
LSYQSLSSLLLCCLLQVLDMISARHDQWGPINTQHSQVRQLAQKQQHVTEAALGLDSTAAAATLAANTAGQPVQQLLAGFISVSVPPGSPSAVTALPASATSALKDAAAAQQLLDDALYLVGKLNFWEDGYAMLAWLMLRSGELDTAADVAEAPCRSSLLGQPVDSSKQPGWRWWVLAQVKWHQGDLTTVGQLLQEGCEQLNKHTQGADSSSSSGGGSSPCLWRLLLPRLEELAGLEQQTCQLLSLKQAGNTAVQAKQYSKAAEAYTKALALQPSSRFAAVIHSNRAAAGQRHYNSSSGLWML